MSKSLDFTELPRFRLHPPGVHQMGVHEETGLTLIILLGGKVKHTPSFFRVFLFNILSIDNIDYYAYNLIYSAKRSGHDEAEPDVYVSYVHVLACVMSTLRI